MLQKPILQKLLKNQRLFLKMLCKKNVFTPTRTFEFGWKKYEMTNLGRIALKQQVRVI